MGQFMSTQNMPERETRVTTSEIRPTKPEKNPILESHPILLMILCCKLYVSGFHFLPPFFLLGALAFSTSPLKLPGLQGHITEVDSLIFSLSHVFGFHRSLCFTSMQDGIVTTRMTCVSLKTNRSHPLDLIYPPQNAGEVTKF